MTTRAGSALPGVRAVALLVAVVTLSCGGDGPATTPAVPSVPPADPTPTPAPPIVVPSQPADPTPIPPVEEACGDWEELTNGPYRYSNNVWNKGATPDYEQCMMRRVVEGEDQYGWRWRWPDDGRFDVRAYPEVIVGRKPWDSFSSTDDLPRRIDAIERLEVNYEVYMSAEGEFNMAFSMWVTTDNPPTPDGITHEIMIWVDSATFVPRGPEFHVDNPVIDGAGFTLFIEQNENAPGNHASLVGQKYVGFVRSVKQYSGVLNLRGFLDYLVAEGHMTDDLYVNTVELGNEVMYGAGEVWLKTFDVLVE